MGFGGENVYYDCWFSDKTLPVQDSKGGGGCSGSAISGPLFLMGNQFKGQGQLFLKIMAPNLHRTQSTLWSLKQNGQKNLIVQIPRVGATWCKHTSLPWLLWVGNCCSPAGDHQHFFFKKKHFYVTLQWLTDNKKIPFSKTSLFAILPICFLLFPFAYPCSLWK